MSIGYKVNVNDAFLHFDLEKESISQLSLDAVSVEANKFHILHQNTPYKAEIINSDFLQKLYGKSE